MAAAEAAQAAAAAEAAAAEAARAAEEARLKEEERQRELKRLRLEACVEATEGVMETMLENATLKLVREAARARRWICASERGKRNTRLILVLERVVQHASLATSRHICKLILH